MSVRFFTHTPPIEQPSNISRLGKHYIYIYTYAYLHTYRDVVT